MLICMIMTKTPPKSRAQRPPKIVSKEAPPRFNGWDDVAPEDRNIAQKIAAKTKGAITPANILTIAANVTSITGIVEVCKGNFAEGAILFGAGRLGDYGDGKLARLTRTQSWIGEGLDVAGDKVQAIGGLTLMSIFGQYPLEASIPKLVGQVGIVGISYAATKKGADLHPGNPGKWTLGLTGVSMVGFEAANALHQHHDVVAANATSIGSYAVTAISIGTALKTGWDYYQEGMDAQLAQRAPSTTRTIQPQLEATPEQ
jgi:phosphatidylglycerophosphate synthase